MGATTVPDRRVSVVSRTDRPSEANGLGGVLPTVRDILHLPLLESALPELLAGADSLERSVRWVHVNESLGAAELLNGGELLLATGVGWSTDDAALDAFADDLVRVGAAGLVLELGVRFSSVPRALVEACAARDFPLIALHREIKFVSVTEAVHSRIIADQMDALRARDQVNELFTGLSLRGSPPDYIVAQLGRTLNAPVVLEDLNHQVVAVESLVDGDELLEGWEQRSRAAHRANQMTTTDANANASASAAPTIDIVPVEARGIRWGYLVALPGAAHPAGRSQVMQQAAVALALGRLADRDGGEWTRRGHEQALSGLIGGRYTSERGVVARLESAGMAIEGRQLSGLAIGVQPGSAATAAALAAAQAIGADAVAAAHPSSDVPQLMVALSLPRGIRLSENLVTSFATRLATELGLSTPDFALAIGGEAQDVPGLLGSLDEASELLRRNSGAKRRGLAVLRMENRPLLRLVTALGNDPRLQAHSEQMLQPLIEHDIESDGDLLTVLGSFVTHPGNRTKAAAASHLSRSVFYQRIALIEDLLGVDLDDGEIISALHTALIARTSSRG
ncbi:PucR family transcriptional regulator [Leifsonia sp. A12D58]|uniref:PucR family transcriptional regulator n=1 Tax=Leifsonia sp. A12D58 TaxID=3397674 RepID=UPI0039E05C5C